MATHLLVILQGQVSNVVHSVTAVATYEDMVGALKGSYRDQLEEAYWLHLKAWTQPSGESLQ
jgi:hypothetical protein